MAEGGGWASRTSVWGRGKDGVRGTGMEDTGVVVVVIVVIVVVVDIGCYEAMVGGEFCPELIGGIGEGIILTG